MLNFQKRYDWKLFISLDFIFPSFVTLQLVIFKFTDILLVHRKNKNNKNVEHEHFKERKKEDLKVIRETFCNTNDRWIIAKRSILYNFWLGSEYASENVL